MANPATTGDIEARWRPLSADETAVAATLLEDAYEELLSRRPTLEADITAATVKERNVVRVVCAMVKRVLVNPEAWASEAVDDWTGRRSDLVASGALSVTADELALLTPGRARPNSVRLVTHGDL